MAYTYNPHRHVKIWLSKDRDTFLNLENRVRLVTMRDINRSDDIHFVYDSQLLSPTALDDLHSFCRRYNIIPKDVRVDVFPHCETEEETKLITLYNDEISHLDRGGNLAVGSDILRWLKPVYDLGTYTDFDVHVDTRKLAATIAVEKPLLMNIGSTSVLGKAKMAAINNDTISVVDGSAALMAIQSIQQSIHFSCSKQGSHPSSSLLHRNLNQFERQLNSYLPAGLAGYINLEHPDRKALNELIDLSRGKTALEVRQNILSTHSTNAAYAHKYLVEQGIVAAFGLKNNISVAVAHLRKQLESSAGWLGWLLLPKNIYQQQRELSLISDDHALLDKVRSISRLMALKNSVVYTSGPYALMCGLFPGGFIFDKEGIDTQVAPYSFQHYELDKAFISANSVPLHASAKQLAPLLSAEIGQLNDLSWLEEGQQATAIRERHIKDVQSHLSHDFQEMRAKIAAHIQKIQGELSGSFGFYRHREKHAKIDALTQIMGFFGANQFNVDGFQAAILHYRTTDVSASIGTSKTKQLIDDLERFGQQAKHLMLTDAEGRIALSEDTTTTTGASVSL